MIPRRVVVPRRATVTQADIARAIRAAKATGLTIARIVVRVDGVAIETVDAPSVEVKPTPALKGWDDVVNR